MFNVLKHQRNFPDMSETEQNSHDSTHFFNPRLTSEPSTAPALSQEAISELREQLPRAPPAWPSRIPTPS